MNELLEKIGNSTISDSDPDDESFLSKYLASLLNTVDMSSNAYVSTSLFQASANVTDDIFSSVENAITDRLVELVLGLNDMF